MNKVTIHNTSLVVSKLSFGTGSLHHIFSFKERLNVLNTAFNQGFTHFDTSPYYGFGLAERMLGFMDNKDQISIATKIGIYPPNYSKMVLGNVYASKLLSKIFPVFNKPFVSWSLDQAKKSFELSLKRLNVACIDVLFLHEPNFHLIGTEEFHNWLEQLIAQGRIKYYGVAGEFDTIKNGILSSPNLTKIIQTRDSIAIKEATQIKDMGRVLQFTYGYFSGSLQGFAPQSILAKAIIQNPQGSIIISSRSIQRIKSISENMKIICDAKD
jgi:aryl-alcohol dehydrogenase-like predicted oxidoreductase